MFHRRQQSWTPLDGGDLGAGSNLQPESTSRSWYPTASPTYEAVSKNDYELTPVSRPSMDQSKTETAIEGDEVSLLSAREPNGVQRLGSRIARIQRKYSGWRTGLMISACCTGFVFLLNLILTIWATQAFGVENGYGTLLSGECSKTKTASTWIHLAINVLSTLLLSASNYCMQILTAPTRSEIDRAHANGKWLDIGAPSVRNLRHISWKRLCIWICLGLSSLPLHLLYNSAVYDTLSANEYNLYAGSEQPQSWKEVNGTLTSSVPSTSVGLFDKAQHGQLEKLDNRACIQAYAQDFVSNRRDVILVHNTTSTNLTFFESEGSSGSSRFPYAWICSGIVEPEDEPCLANSVLADVENWTYDYERYVYINDSEVFQSFHIPIEYCLSEVTPENCQLQFSVKIMIFVIMANLLKLLCMLYTVWSQSVPTIVTAGDAISSFLQRPDSTTVGKCYLSKKSVGKDKWVKRVSNNGKWSFEAVASDPQRWDASRYRWFSAASKTRWTVCYTLCILTIIAAGALEAVGEAGLRNSGYPTDIKSLWNLGFGAVSTVSLIAIGGEDTNSFGLVGNVLLANAAQVILSFLYLSYNSIFTCELLSWEWTSYTQKRKSLRVTSPTGVQRSTYFLQLPYTYSLPLMAFSGLLHWLVSQSIFLARVTSYYEDGTIDTYSAISTCGYSCIAIICVLAVGSFLITAGFLNGFRRYPGNIPLAGTCSAAISAACHPPADDRDAAFKEVRYGEVETKDGVRHCTFTSYPVTTPIAGELYA